MGVDGAFARPEQSGGGAALEGFRSGLPLVDSWARSHASSAKRRGTAVVYVSHAADRSTPAGFYTRHGFAAIPGTDRMFLPLWLP